MPNKKPVKSKHIATQRELAALVERDETQVSRWRKRKDWPFGSAPWEKSKLPGILRWMAETLRESEPDSARPGDSDIKALRKKKLQQEIRKLTAQAATFETALARERGSLIDAAEVERGWAGIGVIVRNGCQSLASQLIPLALSHGLPHESAPVFQSQIEECMSGILRRLSSNDDPEDDSGSDGKILPRHTPA